MLLVLCGVTKVWLCVLLVRCGVIMVWLCVLLVRCGVVKVRLLVKKLWLLWIKCWQLVLFLVL